MLGLPGHLTELNLSAEEVAQQLRAFPALTEDLSVDPGLHIWQLRTSCNSSSRSICGHLHSYSHTGTYSYITKSNKIKLQICSVLFTVSQRPSVTFLQTEICSCSSFPLFIQNHKRLSTHRATRKKSQWLSPISELNRVFKSQSVFCMLTKIFF